MKDLLIEYRKTRLDVLSKIKKLEQFNNNESDDLPLYKSMLADINYVIDWLKEGINLVIIMLLINRNVI